MLPHRQIHARLRRHSLFELGRGERTRSRLIGSLAGHLLFPSVYQFAEGMKKFATLLSGY
jgi:hypothetical protein